MKTIDIQNCTDFRDSMFKVIINGEKHIMRHDFLTVQVPDDKPCEVRIKHTLDGSPAYIFNPKDNMKLQISKNRRLINTSLILLITGLLLVFVIVYFYENYRFISFFPMIGLLFMAVYHTIRRKKFFIIQEVPKSEKVA